MTPRLSHPHWQRGGMLEDRGRARILRIREWAEHVPLVSARVGVAVGGEGGRVLAGREGGVVGRRLRPGGAGGDRWHEEAGQENGQGNAASALAQKARHIGSPPENAARVRSWAPSLRDSICWVPRKQAIPHCGGIRRRREGSASES